MLFVIGAIVLAWAIVILAAWAIDNWPIMIGLACVLTVCIGGGYFIFLRP